MPKPCNVELPPWDDPLFSSHTSFPILSPSPFSIKGVGGAEMETSQALRFPPHELCHNDKVSLSCSSFHVPVLESKKVNC